MAEPNKFSVFLKSYILGVSKSVKRFAEENRDKGCPPLATLQHWRDGYTQPNIGDERFEEKLAFLPEEIRDQAKEFAVESWIENYGVPFEYKNIKDYISKQKTLGKILNEYLEDSSIPAEEKSTCGYIKKIMSEWKIGEHNLSKLFLYGKGYLSNLLQRGNNMDDSMLEKLLVRQENEKIPRSHLLDGDDYLKLLRLNKSSFRSFNSPQKEESGFISDAQKSMRLLSREQKEDVGMDLYQKIVGFRNLKPGKLVNMTDKKIPYTYFYEFNRYTPEIYTLLKKGRKFNKLISLNDLSDNCDIRIISKALYPNDKKMEEDVAHALAGIEKTYTKDALFKEILDKNISFNDAFFIRRFQLKKSRAEMAADFGITEDAYGGIEKGHRHLISNTYVIVFAEKHLGITSQDPEYNTKIRKLLEVKKTSLVNYDPKILSYMKRGLQNYIDGIPLDESCLDLKTGIKIIQENRRLADITISANSKTSARRPLITLIKEYGILPDYINESNKHHYLSRLAGALGVPEIDKELFTETVYGWSEATKEKTGNKFRLRDKVPIKGDSHHL